MAKPEWGKKHICASCGAPFYDLKRKEIVCPSCGEQLKQTTSKSRASTAETKTVSKEIASPAAKPAKELVNDDDIEIDDEDIADDDATDDDDDDVLEDDTALIGDDEGEESLEALDDSDST